MGGKAQRPAFRRRQYKKIPRSLRHRILEFYRFAGVESLHPQALSQLPGSLNRQLQLFNHRTLFLRIAFFKNCDASELNELVSMIAQEYTWPGNTVVQEGESARGLYMISRGFVKGTFQGATRALLTTPDFFGDESLATEVPSRLTISSITLSQFMFLESVLCQPIGCLPHEPRRRGNLGSRGVTDPYGGRCPTPPIP